MAVDSAGLPRGREARSASAISHIVGKPVRLVFDDEETIQVHFDTVRPGVCKSWVEGLEDRGMTGTITIQ